MREEGELTDEEAKGEIKTVSQGEGMRGVGEHVGGSG